ncbi:MAG: M20/M25/M40 family metallo-hydrolase [Brevinema sp.]
MSVQPVVSYFMDMAAIASPSFHEKPVFDYVQKFFESKKADPSRFSLKRIPYTDKKGQSTENMVIRIKGNDDSKKSLFFDAHADTVPPCEKVTPILDKAKGIIRSDGTSVLGADDKAGIAAMLVTIDWILQHNPKHGELVFIISSAEEVGLIGAQYLPDSELTNIDFGFILDSGGPVGKINIEAPYHYDYTITVKGRASHAGMEPEKGLNAIKLAAALILDLPSGRISPNTVSNVGIINGGLARNVVPDTCTIIGEFRSTEDANCQPLIKQVQDVVAKHKPLAVDVLCELNKSNEGYRFTADSPIVAFTTKALADIGIKAEYESSTGGTNANIYTGKGVTSTVISVGMEEIHSVNEYIRIKDLEDTARLLVRLIENS